MIKNLLARIMNYKLMMIAFLVIILLLILFFLYRFVFELNPVILGDWLINYADGGFKRRGLSGTVFFALQDLFNVRLAILVFIVTALLYVFFFANLIRLLIGKRISPLYFTLVISPLTFLFYVHDITIIGRKEVLIYSLFSIFILFLSKGTFTKAKEWWVMTGIFVASLFHELVFFYVPYFIIAYHAFGFRVKRSQVLGYTGASLIPVVCLFFFGGEINQGQTYAILSDRGVNIYGGIFEWDQSGNARMIMDHVEGYLLYLPVLLFGLIHIFVFLKASQRTPKGLFTLILLAIAYSAPLFALAIDWGRWLHIHFTLVVIMLGGMLPDNPTWAGSKLSFKPTDAMVLVALPLFLFFAVSHYQSGLGVSHVVIRILGFLFASN